MSTLVKVAVYELALSLQTANGPQLRVVKFVEPLRCEWDRYDVDEEPPGEPMLRVSADTLRREGLVMVSAESMAPPPLNADHVPVQLRNALTTLWGLVLLMESANGPH